MATKKTKTLEELLKEAGFTTVTAINERVIHASIGNSKLETRNSNLFSKAHAAFVQTSCKHPTLVGASRLPMATSNDVLVVHVQAVTEESEPEAPTSKPETE